MEWIGKSRSDVMPSFRGATENSERWCMVQPEHATHIGDGNTAMGRLITGWRPCIKPPFSKMITTEYTRSKQHLEAGVRLQLRVRHKMLQVVKMYAAWPW